MIILKKTILKYVFLLLTLLFAALLQIDWPLALGLSTASKQIGTHSNETNQLMIEPARDFLLKQYDSAIKEIKERIGQESTLFAMKFSLIGAILGLMFTSAIISNIKKGKTTETSTHLHIVFNPLIIAMFCWAATITSAVIDTRIMYHCDIISVLGEWIKTHVEPVLYGSTEVVGWETFLGDPKRIFNLPAYAFLRSDTSILTFILFLSNTIVFSSNSFLSSLQSKRHRELCNAGSMGCFFIFFLVSIHFRYDKEIDFFIVKVSWISTCLFVAILGAICSNLYWKLFSYQTDKPGKDVKNGAD